MKAKSLIAILALACASSAFAIDSREVGQAGFDKLTTEQQAALLASVAKQAKDNSAKSNLTDTALAVVEKNVTPDKVGGWVDVGTKIGAAMASAAAALGVAVNNFAATPVGLITITLIVWHFMGAMIVHLIGGMLIAIVGLSAIYVVMRRQFPEIKTYDYEKLNWRGQPRVASIKPNPVKDENATAYVICAAVVLGVSIWVAFGY